MKPLLQLKKRSMSLTPLRRRKRSIMKKSHPRKQRAPRRLLRKRK